MEVMGLMLGEFVDEYTVRVIDVFAMPQSGTGVSVEAVDPVFQAKMLDMLKQTGKFTHTGKSFSESLILASTNPQYDKRFFIELQVQYMKIASSEHAQNMLCT